MKTIIKEMVALMCIITTVLVYSCSKENMHPASNNAIAELNTENIYQSARALEIRSFNEDIGDCAPPAVNCLPDIIITARTKELIQLIDSLIAVGKAREFFHGPEWRELFPDLKGKPMGDLQSGKVTLMKNPFPASPAPVARSYVNYSIVYEGATDPLDGPNYGD